MLAVVHYDTAGVDTFLQFDDADDTRVPFVEGTGNKVGRYTITNEALVTAELPADTYYPTVRWGDYTDLDEQGDLRNSFTFQWNGLAETTGNAPAAQRPVADDFTALIPKRSSGSVTAIVPIRIKTSEDVTAAADFSELLAIGDRLATIVSVTSDSEDAITLTALGVDRQLAKFEVTDGVANASYTVVVTVTTVFGATLEGQLIVSYTS